MFAKLELKDMALKSNYWLGSFMSLNMHIVKKWLNQPRQVTDHYGNLCNPLII